MPTDCHVRVHPEQEVDPPASISKQPREMSRTSDGFCSGPGEEHGCSVEMVMQWMKQQSDADRLEGEFATDLRPSQAGRLPGTLVPEPAG